MDMAPDKLQLQNVSHKDNGSFKEYVQQLRELASQVEPSLAEKELTDWFMDTIQPDFYEKMVRNVSLIFFDLVVVGIRI